MSDNTKPLGIRVLDWAHDYVLPWIFIAVFALFVFFIVAGIVDANKGPSDCQIIDNVEWCRR